MDGISVKRKSPKDDHSIPSYSCVRSEKIHETKAYLSQSVSEQGEWVEDKACAPKAHRLALWRVGSASYGPADLMPPPSSSAAPWPQPQAAAELHGARRPLPRSGVPWASPGPPSGVATRASASS